jgi:hypothetical protein
MPMMTKSGSVRKGELPSTLQRSPAKAQRTFAEAHDSAAEQYGEGRRAHQTAYGALKHSFAAATRQRVTTGVTCPTVRIHPAVIAQAAATSQLLLDGRFVLGVGSGENLNEHILGDHWPPVPVTEDMVADRVPCGPDPERHLAAVREYLDAGFDEVYVNQIGPDQQGFFDLSGQ